MVPVSLIFLSVPDSAPMAASCAAAGEPSIAPRIRPTRSYPVRARMTASRRARRQHWRRFRRDVYLLALPLRHHGGRQRIADHVGGGTAHVEELIDADDQQQAGLGQIET